MGEIINFPGRTLVAIPPEKILDAAARTKFNEVLVLGFTEDGSLYAASSTANGGVILWLMDRARRRIHELADEMEKDDDA